MKLFLFSFFIGVSCSGFGQQNFLSLHSFYKDQIFANKLSKPYNDGSFFPVTESAYNLIPAINDSSKQYYTATHILFQNHLLQAKGDDYFLTIDPILITSIGRNRADTNVRTLFQNTRGVHVEGDLFEKFSFSTSLYENQARFNNYETDYYSSVGELDPNAGSGYNTQNAVIPGGARTKPFKEDAFDYAYAVGYFVFSPFKALQISAGNNSQFVGDGHRSILLGDNSINAPYVRVDWRISSQFSFTYLRSKHTNLMRRPFSGSVESYYESKGYSVNYLTYKPSEKISLSLFESGNWNRGDSITSTYSHPLYYNPIPLVSGLSLQGKNKVSSLIGLNSSWQLADKHRVYGQFAINDFDSKQLAAQAGYRGYDFFNLGDLMLQVEYNYVSSGTYETQNRRLNNVQYNLPVAHIKGNGFQEILARANYEYKRLYLDLALSYYLLENYSATSLLPVYREMDRKSTDLVFINIELGYRFNRLMNLSIFGAMTYRSETGAEGFGTNSIQIGLRTGITNQYKDF